MTPSFEHGGVTSYLGDNREIMRGLPDKCVQTCVTSPPYFGLRDYGCDGQIGLEETPEEYVAALVDVFREVRRVLRDDSTVWLNLGDSYAGSWGAQGRQGATGQMSSRSVAQIREKSRISLAQIAAHPHIESGTGSLDRTPGLKQKDLIGIPWRVAFALQADGWYLRSDIIWSKPNPMPESVTDRPTKAHEYIFLLSKSAKYYYDAEAIKEPCAESSVERAAYGYNHAFANQFKGSPTDERHPEGKVLAPKGGKNAFRGQGHFRDGENGPANREGRDMREVGAGDTRNRRTVWTVATQPCTEAHFATFPPELIRPCIRAGAPVGGAVLDPFFGSGTTGLVARQEGRRCIGIDLNPTYIEIQKRRLNVAQGVMELEAA